MPDFLIVFSLAGGEGGINHFFTLPGCAPRHGLRVSMAYIYYGMNIDPAKRRQSAPTFLENADAPFGSSSQLKVPDNSGAATVAQKNLRRVFRLSAGCCAS